MHSILHSTTSNPLILMHYPLTLIGAEGFERSPANGRLQPSLQTQQRARDGRCCSPLVQVILQVSQGDAAAHLLYIPPSVAVTLPHVQHSLCALPSTLLRVSTSNAILPPCSVVAAHAFSSSHAYSSNVRLRFSAWCCIDEGLEGLSSTVSTSWMFLEGGHKISACCPHTGVQ